MAIQYSPQSQDDRLLSTNEAAEILNVHPNTVRSWCEKGYIRYIRIGNGNRRFRRATIEALISDDSHK